LNPKTEWLKPIGAAFFRNVSRVDSLCWFPAVVADEALRKQLWRDYAIVKVTGKLTLRKTPFDRKTEKAISLEVAKLERAEHEKKISSDDQHKRRRKCGVRVINELLCPKGEVINLSDAFGSHASIQSILFSAVIEAWIAFETLANVLFFTALDKGLPKWRISVQNRRSEFAKGNDFKPRGKVTQDPQANWGSVLKEGGDIPLQNMRSIKSWYKTAFGSKVEKAFKMYDGYIVALAMTRNVIVHNAGIADAPYLREMRKIPAFCNLIRGVKKGKPIRLNGRIVRYLRNASIIVATELVQYVDNELSRAKPKGAS
jgi:hypothetical protein